MSSAQTQLNTFFAKYTPAMAKLGKALLAKMRQRLPGAFELIYDNYNALVIGFGASERPSEAVFSQACYADHVSLCFLRGALELNDPEGLLEGGGNRVRHVKLYSVADFDAPALQDLISQAAAVTLFRVNSSKKGKMIIRSVSAKQRPRRPSQS